MEFYGSIDLVSGSVTASVFTGSFAGNADGLYNIQASGVTGLNLSQIANGSNTASISTEGFNVDTDTSITGSLKVSGKITAEQYDVIVVSSSILYQSGSTKFGDSLDDIHNLTGSVNISGSISLNGEAIGTGKLNETTFNSYTTASDSRFGLIETSTGSFNSFTSSINTTIKSKLNSENVVSGSIQVNLTGTTGYSTFSSSINESISNLSGSVATTTNNLSTTITNLSGSVATTTNNLSTTITNLSSSVATTTNNLSSSIATTDLSQNNRLDTIEGRYATTGSNLFKGTQTLSGSIIPSVDNTYDLGSTTYQWRDVYISSGSLYIDGTKVLSSTNQELTFTTDTGQSFKILESTTDNITLQTADGDIELKTSADGDILLDPTNGKITLKGPVEILNGNKIQSSVGGTPVVFANDIVVSGSIDLTGTIEGIDLTIFSSSINTRVGNTETSVSSLNSLTSSVVSRIGSLETESGSVRTTLNSYTSSANGRLSSIETTTGSIITTNTTQDGRLTSIESKTGSYATTGSNVFLGSQTITGSLYISQDLIVAGSSSIQHISSSIVNIADNIITVNAQNPGVRFGGIAVIDSGSSPQVSGSLLFDATENEWIFVHQNQSSVTSALLIMGPETYNDIGNEIHLTNNRLVKSTTDEHIGDSNISDNGTTVTILSNAVVNGTFSATGTTLISGSSQVSFNGITDKPTLVSGSSQIVFGSISSLPTLVSGSSQVSFTGLSGVPSGLVSGSSQITFSSVSGIPGGLVSGSSQIDLTATTNYSTGIKTRLNAEGVISGSAQITLTSGQVTSGLGYTPYNSTNPSGYISSYTETSTLANVTARGSSTTTSITAARIVQVAHATSLSNASYSIESAVYANAAQSPSDAYPGYGFHKSNVLGLYLYATNSSTLRIRGDGGADVLVYHSGNLTNLNQLTNGPGYITGISFANVSSKPTTISGYGITDAITTSNISSQSVSNASTVANLTPTQFFNNMGANHSTRTSFDASTPSYDFGFRYVQGSTNGPGTGGSQFYSWYIGLGNDYPATGGGSYGAMFAVDRNVTTPYLSVRYNENNSFGSWRRIHAGYADSAGTAGNITAYTINQSVGTSNSPTFAGLSSNGTITITSGTPTGAASNNANSYLRIDSAANQYIELRTNASASGAMQGMLFTDNGVNGFIGFKEYTGGSNYGEAIHISVTDYSSSDAGNGIYLGASSNNANGVTSPWFSIRGGTSYFYGNVLPDTNNSRNLGSASVGWANVYTNDLHLSNMNKPEGNDVDGTNGNWTIQEGAENLYIINNNNGKKFKISLEEII